MKSKTSPLKLLFLQRDFDENIIKGFYKNKETKLDYCKCIKLACDALCALKFHENISYFLNKTSYNYEFQMRIYDVSSLKIYFFQRNSHKFIHYLNMGIVYASYSFIKKTWVLIYNLREVVNAWKGILSGFSLGLTFTKFKLHQIYTPLLLRASPNFTRIELRPYWWIGHL